MRSVSGARKYSDSPHNNALNGYGSSSEDDEQTRLKKPVSTSSGGSDSIPAPAPPSTGKKQRNRRQMPEDMSNHGPESPNGSENTYAEANLLPGSNALRPYEQGKQSQSLSGPISTTYYEYKSPFDGKREQTDLLECLMRSHHHHHFIGNSYRDDSLFETFYRLDIATPFPSTNPLILSRHEIQYLSLVHLEKFVDGGSSKNWAMPHALTFKGLRVRLERD